MLIGIDASRANEDQKTGVGWYAWHLIRELKTQNTRLPEPEAQAAAADGQAINKTQQSNVRFVLYTREPLKGELAKLPENWTQKVLKWPPQRFWTQIRLSWEMLVNPPDVLFIPAHVFPIIHPKKTIMTVHDTAALHFPESYNWFERWYTVWSARYAVRKLWKIIVPSYFAKEELLRDIGDKRYEIRDKEKIAVIPHGYDGRYKRHEIGDKRIGEILKKYNIERPFILSVGRLEEKKNTARIIEAFDFARKSLITYHLSLILIGPPGHGYNKVETVINSSFYKKDIKTLGYVGTEDLSHIMSAAEVFVFPSLYEGFGLPILEALACGVPVVAGKGSCLEEVGGEACVYVDPTNVDEIARAIKFARQNFSPEAGFRQVGKFSWEKSAKQVANLLGLA